MSVKSIFGCKTNYSGALYSLLVFAFFGLTALNNSLNFDVKSGTKVRDAASFLGEFSVIEKIASKKLANTNDIASHIVPATSSRAQAPSVLAVSYPQSFADFSLPTPAVTSDSGYISPYETRILLYNNRFLFGHSSNAMNWVKSAGEGNTVSVVTGGIRKTYRIIKKITLPRAQVDAVYRSISESATYRGKTYDLSMMTCGDGTFGADGNNNAYRTFIFANLE